MKEKQGLDKYNSHLNVPRDYKAEEDADDIDFDHFKYEDYLDDSFYEDRKYS